MRKQKTLESFKKNAKMFDSSKILAGDQPNAISYQTAQYFLYKGILYKLTTTVTDYQLLSENDNF